MKSYQTLIYLFLLMFIFSCRGVENSDRQDFTYPSKKNNPRIMFPMEAQTNGYSGTARVFIFVSEEGEVQQAGLEESSGYDVLDEAALNYCNQLLFTPAMMNGEPVSSRIVQNFRFNFIDRDLTGHGYVSDVNKLYKLESYSSGEKQTAIQNRILKKHKAFLKEMDDALNFNLVICKVLLPETESEWSDLMGHWPLSFLLYHDFLQRFPGNDSAETVKNYLSKAIEADVQYIKSTKMCNVEAQNEKTKLLEKIEAFVEKNYPEFRIENLKADEINS